MSEHVYATPDLATTVQYARFGQEEEEKDRGDRVDRIVDIYVSADQHDPGRQQEPAQRNTAPEQHGGIFRYFQVGSRAATLCLGLLCLILSAAIIILVINNSKLREENNTIKMIISEGCEGWQIFGRACYYVSNEGRSWDESRRYCREKNSDLIVIDSQEKQDFVDTLKKRVWLGLTDREEEGTFKWVDGTLLTTSMYWFGGQPDNNGDCVEFINGNGDGRGWNDGPCRQPLQWICERVIY